MGVTETSSPVRSSSKRGIKNLVFCFGIKVKQGKLNMEKNENLVENVI